MLEIGTRSVRQRSRIMKTRRERRATSRNNSIVPRFYESLLKPVITAADTSAHARAWYAFQRNPQ